jgi:NAD(P)-dependent dehydrogenase (short-subunit alcohol dehydrogenase family)
MSDRGSNAGGVPGWRNDAGLVDRHVIVTGAAGGIGRATAIAFAQAGSRVVAVDRFQDDAQDLVRSLPGSGHKALGCDLADLSAHAEILRAATDGAPLAALAHLAAVLVRKDTVGEITEEDWDIQHSVNLKATFFLNRAVRDVFVQQGTGGAIVNFSSQGWWTGGFGGSVVYSASKGGVVSMSRGLARSFAPDNVRVNVIAPGGVDTTMLHGGQDPQAIQGFISMIPMGRLAEPEEMTGAVLFLASDASSYITGALINISGGQLMY